MVFILSALWWAGPSSVNLQYNFLLKGGAVLPPCCLTWGQTMVEVMKIMATSFKRSQAGTAAFTASDPAAIHCWPMLLLEIPGCLSKSGSVFCGVTASFSWVLVCTIFCLCPSILFPQSCVNSGSPISNLRYAEDTTLMAKSEEELKSLLKKEN